MLRSNPLTGPYPIRVDWKGGAVRLSGAVGTSQVHDIAVRTVIGLGYPVKDDLVIDTAAAHRVALIQAAAIPGISSSWGHAGRLGALFRLSSAAASAGLTIRSSGSSHRS